MATEEATEGNIEQQKKVKKPKKRVKGLHKSILTQMEFYFGDSNLGKDRFLSKLIKETADGYIDLSVFLKFNKIRALTTDVDVIRVALAKSEILKVSEDGKLVKRITSVKEIENVDEMTVYVENLPRDATHEWIKDSFKQFGLINYVSLPKFKVSQRIKGFAFVEFDNIESAGNACKYFGDTPYLPSSPVTKDESTDKNASEPKKSTKRQREDDDDDKQTVKKNKINRPDPSLSVTKADKTVPEGSHKKPRNHKKKHKEKNEADTLPLSVMPKLEWKRLKNKYLALQKASMAEVKKCFAATQKDDHPMMPVNPLEPDYSEIQVSKMPEFVAGVIIKIGVDEPFSDSKQIRSEMKAILGVTYVDIHDERTDGYIRCNSAENTDRVIKAVEHRGNITVLQGKEEEEYWRNLFIAREAQHKTRTKPKQRGCNRIMQKVVRSLETSKHIRFD